MKLAETILRLRRENGYTQEQLAVMLGVSTAAVSKWECANAYPDITLLPEIADIFKVSIDYLLDYDMSGQRSISDIITHANDLRRVSKFDEAEALIAQTLARYPNHLPLTFELARHRFINARYKRKTERENLFTQAAKGFEYVAEQDTDEKRRAWSLYFLTTICLIRKEYDKASAYNAKLLGARGLYPRATAAIIKMNQAPDDDALRCVRAGLYDCIREFSMLIPWLTPYLMEKGDYDAVISENLRASVIYEQFTDCGWIYNDLSCCYESVALAYSEKREYDLCLDYLEKACYCAEKYDILDPDTARDLYDNSDMPFEDAEKLSSRHSMYMALTSGERGSYEPICTTERYQKIMDKLTVGKAE